MTPYDREHVIKRAVEAVVKGEFIEVRHCTAVVDLNRRTVDIVYSTHDRAMVHGLQSAITTCILGALPRNFRVSVETYDVCVH